SFMSHPPVKTLWLLCLLLMTSGVVLAQPKDNTPFSQFGIGDFLVTGLPSSQGMGGMNNVYHDFFEANLDNPASLGFLQYTSLQMGLYARRSAIKRIEDKANVWSGNLDHLSLNIPIINPLNEALERRESKVAFGTSISLRPLSQVGYDVRITDSLPEFDNIQRSFTGTGGLYQIHWSNGIKYKNLAVGFNLGYLYGRQTFQEDVNFLDLGNPYTNVFTRSIAYKGVMYKLGLLYDHPLDLKAARAKDDKPSRFLSFGATWNGENSFDTEADVSQYLFNPLTGDVDTAFVDFDRMGGGRLPGTFGFGLMYRRAGHFRLGMDYQSAAWSKYTNDARASTMDDSWRIAAGVAFIPD